MNTDTNNIIHLFDNDTDRKNKSNPNISISNCSDFTIISNVSGGEITNTKHIKGNASFPKHQYRNSLIDNIENQCIKRNKTIQKLTLWVLNTELNSLVGLSEFELQKLKLFLDKDK